MVNTQFAESAKLKLHLMGPNPNRADSLSFSKRKASKCTREDRAGTGKLSLPTATEPAELKDATTKITVPNG